MTREEKGQVIEHLAGKFGETPNFYFADGTGMSVEKTDKYRRECFRRGFEYVVVKNSLIEKALERQDLGDSSFASSVLKGFTGIIFSSDPKAPAKLIKEFSKENNGLPTFKGAIVDRSYFSGAAQLDTLITLKTKNELIGDVIGLLQSPMKNVVSGLKGSGSKIAGVLKTLSER
jgi:large subunit ribosomal protein L10